MTRLSCFALILFILGAGTFTACRKDFDNTTVIWDPVSFLNTAVQGSVQDTDHRAVIGAVIRKGDQVTRTDSNGYFYLPPSPTDRGGAPVEISAAGYFTITRTITPVAQGATIVQVQLIPRLLNASFPSSQGALVDVQGATVRFPQDSYLYADGRPYTGEVQVYAAFLDPAARDMQLRMPGNLTAVRADGSAAVLATFGMLGVELRTPAGAVLELAPGAGAEISIPLSGDFLAAAPDEIPLWHFQDHTGRWIEDGKAVKSGNRYVGSVAHFSFWSVDLPFVPVLLSGTVLDQAGNPVQGLLVRATVQSGQGLPAGAMCYTHTNQQGAFSGYVPGGQGLLLEVLNSCSEVVHTLPVNALSGNTALPDIHIRSDAYIVHITGSAADCDSDPLTAPAYVVIWMDGQTSYLLPGSGGEIRNTVLACQASDMLTATLYDPVSSTKSSPASFDIPSGNRSVDLGQLLACKPIEEYFYFEIDNYTKAIYSARAYMSRHQIVTGILEGSFVSLATEAWAGTDPAAMKSLNIVIKDLVTDEYFSAVCGPADCDIRINITENGGAGGFLSGDFSGHVDNKTPVPTKVSGTFRARILN